MTEKKIVKNREAKPCGCHVTEYSDGSGEVRPCKGHALTDAATHLSRASQALGALGQIILQETQAMQLQAAIQAGMVKKT